MHWLNSALASLLPAAAGLIGGGFIARKCAGWYRVSSVEGKAGYFVIGLALLGAAAGFITGLTCAFVINGDTATGYGRTAGIAVLWVLALTVGALVMSRLRADVPPRLDGAELQLEVELQLPAGVPAAAANTSGLELHSVVGRRTRNSCRGTWFPAQARQEAGRWVVPGSVPLFTARGQRMLSVQWDGADLIGYLVPLPPRPGRRYLTWSEWGPRPEPPYPAWPESKPRYRFRIQTRVA